MIRAQNGPWYRGIECAIYIKRGQEIDVVKDLQLTRLVEGEVIPTALILKENEAQLLMDDLWHCGLRPSEGMGSAGQLKATQDHLEDMRKISFDLLGLRTK